MLVRLTAPDSMHDDRTITDIWTRIRDRRRRKRCPRCGGVVSIRGFHGEYQWSCLECDAIGIGYRSRSTALEGIQH